MESMHLTAPIRILWDIKVQAIQIVIAEIWQETGAVLTDLFSVQDKGIEHLVISPLCSALHLKSME